MTYLSFIPGPSQVSRETRQDLREAIREDIPSLSHRSVRFYELFAKTREQLAQLLELPRGFEIFFVGSASECMEILARNLAEKKSFHFVNGGFSKRFADLSRAVGNRVEIREIEPGRGFDFSEEEIGSKKRPRRDWVELVGLNYTETPTGVSLAEEELKIFRKKYPQAYIAIDIVSAAATRRIDFRLADAWFFSVQKGFGLPSGLGVLMVNKRALKRGLELQAKGKDTGGCHSFARLWESGQKNQTFETPNVLNIYLLQKQAERFLKKGMAVIERETRAKAKLIYDWVEKEGLEVLCQEEKYRALSVACIKFPAGVKAEQFHWRLQEQGIFMGTGYKELKETHFRLANFPALGEKEILKGLREIKKALGRA